MKIGFISGTSIANSPLFDGWERHEIATEYGPVTVKRRDAFVLLNRHGFDNPVPPHAINYRANIRALKDLGLESLVSLNSVGSLNPDLKPGTLVSCSDYVSFAPVTYFDTSLSAQAPVIANNLISEIVSGVDEPIATGKVYVQTRGPRFETRAEVRIIRDWGDVVGMTLAGEADLSQELGLAYNSLCMIDNYAHGLTDERLSEERFKELVKRNQEIVNRLFAQMLELLA